MFGRAARWLAASMMVVATATTVSAQDAGRSVRALPRGDYEVHWRQVDGAWLSQARRSTMPGCDYPAHDACGRPGGGPFHAGATIPYNAFGCTRPPITVQCVVRSRPPQPVGALASGRWVLRTGTISAVLDINVAGNRFSGVSDWRVGTARRDPIIDGRVRGSVITFTRLCDGRITCIQRFTGTLTGDRASGLWTGPGARRPTSWTLERE